MLVARGHALAGKASVTFTEVLAHEFVVPHADCSVHALLLSEAGKLGERLDFKIRISSFECMCQMVEAGLGLAILPRALARPHLKASRLKILSLDEPWARRDLLIGIRNFQNASPTARALIDSLGRQG